MKLTTIHAPRAVWGAPGDSASPERWAMAWKTGLPEVLPSGRPGGTLIVCGLNPSTAWAQDGAGELDPTLTRIHRFASGWGYSAVCMVNLYPYRYTNPKDLWGAIPWAFDGVAATIKACDAVTSLSLPGPFTVVAAWGTTAPPSRTFVWSFGPKWPQVAVQKWHARAHKTHTEHTARYLQALGGGQLWCWGTTKTGHPRHPLYLPATAQLQPWRAP